VVTNGPAITWDGRFLYHVDSGARTIWRFTMGPGPSVAHHEVFLQLTEADGHPDGVVLDSEDCLWVALWDGWGLRRYAPDGTLLLSVVMPCARVTKLAFGGADLRTGFVTTARVGLDAAQLAAQPDAGSLFAFTAPVPGRVLAPVRLPGGGG
jgi:sugar lactone lactonase YvrE